MIARSNFRHNPNPYEVGAPGLEAARRDLDSAATMAVGTRQIVWNALVALALRTPRLVLREWRVSDRAPFGLMSADPEVMAMLPPLPDRAVSDAWIAQTIAHWGRHGFGFWALEIPGEASLNGAVGLHAVSFPPPFPRFALAWRLAREYWGQGYAFEAARAVIDDGFRRLGFDEIVAYATIVNRRSIALMRRLGMSRDAADDFNHPRLPDGHPFREHVLYRVRRA
jgi:ribosomal-protein-alanine N-acetyltransferase